MRGAILPYARTRFNGGWYGRYVHKSAWSMFFRRYREAEFGLVAACPTVANLALPARRLADFRDAAARVVGCLCSELDRRIARFDDCRLVALESHPPVGVHHSRSIPPDNLLLFPKLGIFPWLMIAGATIFLRPDWPLHALRRLRLRWSPGRLLPDHFVADATADHESASTPSSWAARAIVITIAILALFQVLMPLRHFAYSGNVRWTEEGYLFAWRVMLTEKTGLVHYRVSDQDTGETWLVTPDDYLTPLQVERMSFQPDLILQTAHIIADDFDRRGYSNVQVMAEAFVAWNGRPNGRLVDPDVNLAKFEPGIAPKSWVLPYEISPKVATRRQ